MFWFFLSFLTPNVDHGPVVTVLQGTCQKKRISAHLPIQLTQKKHLPKIWRASYSPGVWENICLWPKATAYSSSLRRSLNFFFLINIYSLLHEIISDLLDCSLPVPSRKETKRKTKRIFLLFTSLKSHSYKDREQKRPEQLHSSAWAWYVRCVLPWRRGSKVLFLPWHFYTRSMLAKGIVFLLMILSRIKCTNLNNATQNKTFGQSKFLNFFPVYVFYISYRTATKYYKQRVRRNLQIEISLTFLPTGETQVQLDEFS